MPLLLPAVAASCFSALVDMREFAPDECIGNPSRAGGDIVFCNMHLNGACCSAAGDERVQDYFAALTDTGRSCSQTLTENAEAYKELRRWYCLGCDPMEPMYRFRTALGDDRNGIKPDPSSGKVWTWRVCLSFAEKVWNYHKVKNGQRYSRCGIKTPNPCEGGLQQLTPNTSSSVSVLQGWNAYLCGDNNVVPSKFFQGPWQTAAKDFLSSLPPPNLPDFKFELVNDGINTNFRWDDTPCFGASSSTAPSLLALLLASAFIAVVI